MSEQHVTVKAANEKVSLVDLDEGAWDFCDIETMAPMGMTVSKGSLLIAVKRDAAHVTDWRSSVGDIGSTSTAGHERGGVLGDRLMQDAERDLVPSLRDLPFFHSLYVGTKDGDLCLLAVLSSDDFADVETTFGRLHQFINNLPGCPGINVDVDWIDEKQSDATVPGGFIKVA